MSDEAAPGVEYVVVGFDDSGARANRVPLLLLTGGADIYLPPALLRRVAPRVGAAVAVVAPEAGHPLFAEAPAAFNRIVLRFFAGGG